MLRAHEWLCGWPGCHDARVTSEATPGATSAPLYLARHGRTALNAEGRLRGLADPPLDEVGVQEAERLAADLAGRGFVRVLSSPLGRAVHTARLIADAAGVPHLVDERFNDRDYGPWTGHLKSAVVAEFGSVDAAPGVEPKAAVLHRVLPALDDVVSQGPVVIVTHDAVIRPVLLSIEPGRTGLVVDTASWSELAFSAAGWRVVSCDNRPRA